jgi:glyoxylase-like metal-dependent hydrolase (beta-lactamase superfamily II)
VTSGVNARVERIDLTNDSSNLSDDTEGVVALFPGLFRIKVPLPGSPLGWVNSYVIKGSDRHLVIDTGLNRKECSEALRSGLRAIDLDLKRTDFFITHYHADHYSLAPSLMTETSIGFINRPDGVWIRNWTGWDHLVGYSALNGFPEEEIASAIGSHPGLRFGAKEMPEMILVDEGDLFEYGDYRFKAIATPGHTPGHTCLYEPDKQILVSGDHILQDITPNITCWVEDRNPLEQYLSSLEKIATLPTSIVLPGHRRIITDCKARIAELKQHHLHRIDEILAILSTGPKTGYETASRMTWDIDCSSWRTFPPQQKWFATGEALSHLRYLERQGRIIRENKDSLFLFHTADRPLD